jgi:hypothetical protein
VITNDEASGVCVCVCVRAKGRGGSHSTGNREM